MQGTRERPYCSQMSIRDAVVMALVIGMLVGGLLLGCRLLVALLTQVYPNV